jgi:hypothetical protein
MIRFRKTQEIRRIERIDTHQTQARSRFSRASSTFVAVRTIRRRRRLNSNAAASQASAGEQAEQKCDDAKNHTRRIKSTAIAAALRPLDFTRGALRRSRALSDFEC